MTIPTLIITGASGFIGRHLLQVLANDYKIFALARRSQARCGAPVHENIRWIQVDIRHEALVSSAFDLIREEGGADYVLHLAAHYDFTGEEHPDYQRTNVDGLRLVLEECRSLHLKRFIFASSIAACDYPPTGQYLNEDSPPDGKHIYARSKAAGENILAEYDDSIPSCILRFAALFSDWCEYPPLYFFLETWLTRCWNRRLLGGRGRSAIPYLHIRDLASFVRRTLEVSDSLRQREVLLASPDTTMSHRQLFEMAHRHEGISTPRPIFMAKFLCHIGVRARDLLGRISGSRPFERAWMVSHIDRDLRVDPSRTWARLDWLPRGRLLLCRRLPFLLEHRKTDALEWTKRNEAALKAPAVRPNLLAYKLLEKHMGEVRVRVVKEVATPEVGENGLKKYREFPVDVLDWRLTVVYRQLLNALRTQEKGIFTDYCKDLAAKRFSEDFRPEEVCRAFRFIRSTILEILSEDPEAAELMPVIGNLVESTMAFGCDQIFESYEELGWELDDQLTCDDPLVFSDG